MTSDLPFCDILVLQKFPFCKFLMTSLRVICGSSPPPFQSKSLLRLWLECWNFLQKIKRVNNGVARGWAPRLGCHHFDFFFFWERKPLIGWERPFFLVITYFRTENWTPTRFAAKTFFFFFWSFTYILADKECHHEIPPRVPPFLAMLLRVKNV